jgi:hypothetical protein
MDPLTDQPARSGLNVIVDSWFPLCEHGTARQAVAASSETIALPQPLPRLDAPRAESPRRRTVSVCI